MDGLRLESLENIKSLLLVSCGGILGANIRFLIFQRLDEFFIDKDHKIIIINNLASFLLGFSSAILTNHNSLNYSYELGILIVIGFLGGLSSFSTYMYDLFELSSNLKFYKMLKMLILSVISGLIFLSIGFFFGSQ